MIFFSWLAWVLEFWRGDHGLKEPFSSHYVKSMCYQHDLSLLMISLIIWLRKCLSDFSTVKLLFFPSSILNSLKRSHYVWFTLKNEKLCPPWGQCMKYFKFFCMRYLSILLTDLFIWSLKSFFVSNLISGIFRGIAQYLWIQERK